MNWIKSFLDKGKEIMGMDCSGLVPIVSMIVDSERAREREVIEQEVRTNGFSGIKSGRKMAKKLRQVYQRELSSLAGKKTDALFKTFEEHVRPKPWLVPGPVWRLIQRVVLRNYV